MDLRWDNLVPRLSRFDKTRGGYCYWPLVVGGMLMPHTLRPLSSHVNHSNKRLLSSYKYQEECPSRASMPEQRTSVVCLVSISRRSPKKGARIRTTSSVCLLYFTFCVVRSTHMHTHTHAVCVYMTVSACKCVMYHFHLKVYKHKILISRSTIGKVTGP